MIKSIYKIIIFMLFMVHSWADCTFIVTNYSDTPVMVQAGFYAGESTTFTVDVASANTARIKNKLSCDGVSPAGLGITYVTLVGKQSSGGWVYAGQPKMIRAVGASHGNQNFVFGRSPSGTKLALFNNTRPKVETFEVRIEKANRNISQQFGSMD
jgi:hypothetical protein